MRLVDTIEVENELGEGIIWDHGRQRVWWTDILQSELFRYDPTSKLLESWTTPERLCCFAPIKNESRLICAFESGFAFYQPETSELDWIKKLEQDNPGTRFNDGRTDRQGRLWAGTMAEDLDKATYKGSLYCLHSDLTISQLIDDLHITNSLCWSPEGHTLYHTDTPTQTIKRYPFNTATAELGEAEVLAHTEQGCYPDGSIVDAQGYIWNAQWGGSKVVRYSPKGAVDFELSLPTSQPTCVAFGGYDLDLLFVTTAWSEMQSREPGAGNVYVYQNEAKEKNIRGLVESEFILDGQY